jgi:hypothetical protein
MHRHNYAFYLSSINKITVSHYRPRKKSEAEAVDQCCKYFDLMTNENLLETYKLTRNDFVSLQLDLLVD